MNPFYRLLVVSTVTFFVVSAAKAADLAVEVSPVEGTPFSLNEAKFLEGWQLAGSRTGSPLKLLAHDVVSLRFPGKAPLATPKGTQLIFPTGEVLACEVKSSDKDNLLVQSPIMGEIKAPLTAVLGVLLDPDATSVKIAGYVKRIRETPRNADQLLLKNNDMVSGTFISIDDKEIRFDRDAQEVAIPRELAAAIAFDPSLLDYRLGAVFHGQMRLSDGSILNIADLQSEGSKLQGTTLFGSSFAVDADEVADIAFRNGKVVYLSDLQPAQAVSEPFLDDRMPHRADLSVLGLPLRVGGRVYAKGLGVRSHSQLIYDLGDFERFEATVGLDESADREASVRFRVEVDGKSIFDSGEMTRDAEPQKIDAPIKGARRLSLIVEFAKRGDVQDYADWLNARLLR